MLSKLHKVWNVPKLPRVKPDEWKCPKCGAKGDDIQGVGPFTLRPLNDGSGLSVVVPEKIWCMKCGKEYPAYNRMVMS